ncbi:hypothetical protein ACLESD_00155 [Pyxidicoccus sp. 3LFB2]
MTGVLSAVLSMTVAVTGCGGGAEAPDDTEQRDVVVLDTATPSQPQEQFIEAEAEAEAGCSRSQWDTVMNHCEDNHASAYTCCRIRSCQPLSDGRIAYSWSGYYAC